MSTNKGWIGVDFDRTLAEYGSGMWPKLGKPIPKMVERIHKWIALRYEVRIVTARVDDLAEFCPDSVSSEQYFINKEQRALLREWCKTHLGFELPLTNRKDFDMAFLYDDRAVQVIPNTGEIVGEEPELR